MNFEKFSPSPKKETPKDQGEQLFFFDEFDESNIDSILTEKESELINQLLEESSRFQDVDRNELSQNASEIIQDILSTFNKYDVHYTCPVTSDEQLLQKSYTTNIMMANGVTKMYGDMGFYGKVFADQEAQKTYWELWRIADDGNDLFIQGKDGNRTFEEELQPHYSSREATESKLQASVNY